MSKFRHTGHNANKTKGSRLFTHKANGALNKANDYRHKKDTDDGTIKVANCVTQVHTHCIPSYTSMDYLLLKKYSDLTQEQLILVEEYLSDFRDITIPQNSNFKLRAEIIPFDQGVAMRLIFGSEGGNMYCPRKDNIIEASNSFGIDIRHYAPDVNQIYNSLINGHFIVPNGHGPWITMGNIRNNGQVVKASPTNYSFHDTFHVIKPEYKRTYVLLNDGKIIYLIKGFASENWGKEGVKKDIAAIKGATLSL